MPNAHVADATGKPKIEGTDDGTRSVLRLFAGARQAAGTGRASLPGGTVGEVLEEACGRYGPDFDAILAMSRVWLNGEPVERSAVVGEGDEIAVLPPVSGGA